MKRLTAFLMALLLCVSVCVREVYACDENQSNTYVAQIVFGDAAFGRSADEKVEMLMNALYLCSEQADNRGQEKIDFLKRKKVSGISALAKLNISSDDLLECSHNTWEHEYAGAKGAQANRRKILQSTVNKVFDFGFINRKALPAF